MLSSTIQRANIDHSDVLKKDDLKPGDCVSTDQYECRLKRQLPCTKGKEGLIKMFCGGSVFIDHATLFIKLYNKVSVGASDTIRANEMYEAQTNEIGIEIEKTPWR